MNAKRGYHHITSAFDLFGKSYDIVMRNIKTFAVLLFLPFIGSVVSTIRYQANAPTNRWVHTDFFSGTMPAYSIVSIVSLGLILTVLVTVAALILQAMLTGLEVESSTGRTPTFEHLWTLGKKYWLRLFGLFLVIGMYIIGTSLLGLIIVLLVRNAFGMIVGGALVLAAALFVLSHYFLAPYAMIDKDLPVFSAMEYSAKISKGHPGAIFSVLGVAILLSLTGIVPILGPLISFFLGSAYSVAPALRYEELKKLS